jgi:hypothetical protein
MISLLTVRAENETIGTRNDPLPNVTENAAARNICDRQQTRLDVSRGSPRHSGAVCRNLRNGSSTVTLTALGRATREPHEVGPTSADSKVPQSAAVLATAVDGEA